MNGEISAIVSKVEEAVLSLETIRLENTHDKWCIAQARCDLNQAMVFLSDILNPTQPLEPYLGLE